MKHAPRLYDVVLEFIRQCPWSDLRHALAPSAFDLAVDAYADHCESIGTIFQQPSQADSEEKRGIVHLRNVNGPLARYSVKQGKILGGNGDV